MGQVYPVQPQMGQGYPGQQQQQMGPQPGYGGPLGGGYGVQQMPHGYTGGQQMGPPPSHVSGTIGAYRRGFERMLEAYLVIVLIGRPVATCIGGGLGVTSIAARLGQGHIYFWG